MVADNSPSRRVVGDEKSSVSRLSRRTFVTTGALVGAATLFGRPVAAQAAVAVNLSDETGAPGEEVAVTLTIEGQDNPEAQISAYLFDIGFDDDVLSFVEANGIDMNDPTVNDEEPGEVSLSGLEAVGVEVDLTAAELVFGIGEDIEPEEVIEVLMIDGSVVDSDAETISFTSSDGSVTNSEDGDEDEDEGEDEDEDEGEDEDGDEDEDEGEDEDGDEDEDEGEDEDEDEDEGENESEANGDPEQAGTEDDSDDDGFGPGFGVGGALTALGGVGYIIHRRLAGEDSDS